jgi:flagellar FliL protein
MTLKPKLDKIVLALNGLIVAAAVGLVWYSHNIVSPPLTDSQKQFSNLIDSSVSDFKRTPVTFKEIVVNLYSRQRRLRFLNLTMNIEVYDDGQEEIVKTYKPFINDRLIDIAGNMKPDEVNSVTGRILLESRIKKNFNQAVGAKVIKKIYFSKFIVQ